MNKKRLVLVVAILFVVALTACGGGNDDGAADNGDMNGTDNGASESAANYDADAAETTFQQNCATCHGGNLEGKNGPALDKIGQEHSKEEILDIIKNGKGSGMPAGLIQGDEADNVAAWLADHK